MAKVKFKYTWCDYLTPCPYRNNVEVGSYECSQCSYFERMIDSNKPDSAISDYSKYFVIKIGHVECHAENQLNLY